MDSAVQGGHRHRVRVHPDAHRRVRILDLGYLDAWSGQCQARRVGLFQGLRVGRFQALRGPRFQAHPRQELARA